jgi:hypothetical protein
LALDQNWLNAGFSGSECSSRLFYESVGSKDESQMSRKAIKLGFGVALLKIHQK